MLIRFCCKLVLGKVVEVRSWALSGAAKSTLSPAGDHASQPCLQHLASQLAVIFPGSLTHQRGHQGTCYLQRQ